MATGGFRDVSTLSSGRRPRSMTMSDHDDEDMRDVEMNSGTALLEEDGHYFEDEGSPKPRNEHYSRSLSPPGSVRSLAGVKPLVTKSPNDPPPRKLKSILKSLKADRTILLSRPRVVFRMCSLIASGAVLGASGHILFHYLDTRSVLAHDGTFLWKQDIHLTPTNILLAVSTYVFLVDLIFSIVSFWPRGRYLKNKIVAGLALLHSIASFVAGIIALECSEEKRHPNSMFWVCQVTDQDPQDLAIMDFSTHCSEQRATWIMACVYTVAHGLIIPTILLGFISCSWNRKRPTFKDAIIIREDSELEKRRSFSQKFGDLKEKFTRK